jgi:protoporphyrinogen oxidase
MTCETENTELDEPDFENAVSRIAVVGAGFLGLTLALRLSQAGHEVTVFESADEIGGLAGAWSIGGAVWDKHYHVTLLSDSFTRRIVEELGLGDEFEWVETKTGFYTGGELVSMSNSLEFLKFPPLGPIGKLRLGATIFWASRVRDWKRLERIGVERWLTRLSGAKTFDKIWRPLLKAKLGEAYRETSAAFIWATIQRMYAARNSGLKKEMFGYVRGGYARVLARFAGVLKDSGVAIRTGSRIGSIRRSETGDWSVVAGAPEAAEGLFDNVILTCSSGVAARLVPQLPEPEARRLRAVRYQGIVCASLILRKPLSPYYVTNIIDDAPFTGIIEMTAMVDRAEFGGNALVYLPKYVAPDDRLFDQPDEAIRESFVGALVKMYPGFDPSEVVEFKVSRVREVFPLPVLDYSERLPPVGTSLAGLFVLNSSQIRNGTLNVNETIQLAERFCRGIKAAGTKLECTMPDNGDR